MLKTFYNVSVVLWGGTGHARVLAEAISNYGGKVSAVFDRREIPSPIDSVPIYYGSAGLQHWLAENKNCIGEACFSVAIGGSGGRDRLAVAERLKTVGLTEIAIVHPAAWLAIDAKIEAGAQVLAGAKVGSNAWVHPQAIVNTAAQIDHDCLIGAGAHIAPGAILCGEVEVGTAAFIGAGAIVLPRIKIGDDAVIGAGSLVTRDVAPGQTVLGRPARLQVRRHTLEYAL